MSILLLYHEGEVPDPGSLFCISQQLPRTRNAYGFTLQCLQGSNPVTGFENWHAGQHALLSVSRFGFLLSHPATILSTPTSHNRDLIVLLKAHNEFINRLKASATSSKKSVLPVKEMSRPSTASRSISYSQEETARPQVPKYLALVSGPYGSSHSDFRQDRCPHARIAVILNICFGRLLRLRKGGRELPFVVRWVSGFGVGRWFRVLARGGGVHKETGAQGVYLHVEGFSR